MKRHIRPVAKAIGIHKRIGWHTFRHTFGTLLKANGEDIKTVKELLRHANSRITLEASTYSDQFKNYLSNMGTAYAIMALKSCKVPEIP
jgi:site-specific recombinase XerD